MSKILEEGSKEMVTNIELNRRRVTHYTIVEGGSWFKWPDWLGLPLIKDFYKRDPISVIIQDLHVHALKLEGEYEWDCVNGFRSNTNAAFQNSTKESPYALTQPLG